MDAPDNSSDAFPEEKNISFDGIVTSSRGMLKLLETAREIALSDMAVLLTGESGTGKELVARAIHNGSLRKGGPFVVVNCAGIPDTLLESELFGHEKGAFTDAVSQRKGKFELAQNGTLFLDEIGDMSAMAQPKILRAVEQKRFERVGGQEAIAVNCRIIAATNKNLQENIKDGKFREDLYYRLREGVLNLPPLRERKEDIPLLVSVFIKEFNREFHKSVEGVSNVTLSYLMKYDWPGNIRELKSIVKIGMALVERDRVWLEDLPFKIELISGQPLDSPAEDLSLEKMEREHILKILNHTRWNKLEAARLLGISRPTLDRKIKRYNFKNTA